MNWKNTNAGGQGCNGWWEVNSAVPSTGIGEPGFVQKWRPGEWHYVTATWNNLLSTPFLRLYIDGILTSEMVGQPNCGIDTVNSEMWLGVDAMGWEQPANAVMDEFKIYNVQRTGEAVHKEFLDSLSARGSYCVNGQYAAGTNTCLPGVESGGLFCDASGNMASSCVCSGCSGEFRCQNNPSAWNYGSCYRPEPRLPVKSAEPNL